MYAQDLVFVVMLSLPCGWFCTLLGLPPMFGYIICGVLLGPSGLNSIKVCGCVFVSVCVCVFAASAHQWFSWRVFCLQSMVQVETLGELGVFFTLFVVGLEFSPERLRKVNRKDFWFKITINNKIIIKIYNNDYRIFRHCQILYVIIIIILHSYCKSVHTNSGTMTDILLNGHIRLNNIDLFKNRNGFTPKIKGYCCIVTSMI